MKIVVYGTNVSAMGAAALLARAGNDVSMQLSPQDIATRRISVDEPALKALLQEQFEAGRLSSFDTNYPPADAELHWLCLETNELERAKRIVTQADSRHEDKLLIVNQTIFGIGATDQLNDILGNQEQRAVVYLPDSLRGGQIVDSFLKPDQLVIGSSSRWATGRVIAMARVLMSTVPRIRTMSAQEAEFSSLALNGLLAMRLSYINEMANLADSVGIDIETVRETMSGDARIGPHFLKPGCGFGGQKFSGQLLLFSDFLKEKRRSSLLRTVMDINDQQKETLFRKLWRYYKGDLKGKKIAIWGAAYKPGTADIFNAPSLTTIDACIAQGCEVRIHDPLALHNLAEHYRHSTNIMYCSTPEQATDGADALLLVTEWPEYGMRDFQTIAESMRAPVILDGRNMYEPEEMIANGFHYQGIGRNKT